MSFTIISPEVKYFDAEFSIWLDAIVNDIEQDDYFNGRQYQSFYGCFFSVCLSRHIIFRTLPFAILASMKLMGKVVPYYLHASVVYIFCNKLAVFVFQFGILLSNDARYTCATQHTAHSTWTIISIFSLSLSTYQFMTIGQYKCFTS